MNYLEPRTELEAWDILANVFSRPCRVTHEKIVSRDHDGYAIFGEDTAECICDALNILFPRFNEIKNLMYEKIKQESKLKFGKYDYCNFLWPRNKEGALERSAFCKRQADNLRI